MEVYKSNYLEVNYYSDYDFFEVCWLSETVNMSVKEYKSEFLNYLGLFEKFSVNRVLVNEQKLSFSVNPDLQEWVNKNIFLKLPPLYLAIVFSEDMIAQLAVEQLLDEKESKSVFFTKFFSEKEEAKKWILSV